MMGHISLIPHEPALVIHADKRYLVLTDLHIGFEHALESNSIFVGKNSTTDETISDVERLVADNDADVIVLLGDIKAGIRHITRREWDDVPLFFERICRIVDVMLIPGNHDANIQRLVPDKVIQASPSGLVIDDMLLTHGHMMPSANFAHVNRMIMGHIHPVFIDPNSVLNGQRVWVSARVCKGDMFPSSRGVLEVVIMPSYNRYFYATHKNRHARSISPIVQRMRRVDSARIITLDGSIIGDQAMLDRVL